MRPRLASPSLMLCAAVLSAQAFAEPSAQPLPRRDTTEPAKASAIARPPVRTAAAALSATTAPATVMNVNGSVIVLADGIVANATRAQIATPAPGFVYER